MNIKSVIFSLALVFFVSGLAAQPISSDKLFTSPSFSEVRMSPDGRLVSAYYIGEKNKALLFIDTKAQKVLTRLDFAGDTQLSGYQWLSNNRLYIRIEINNDIVTYIGTLANNKVKVKPIKASGYLLSRLPKEDNKVMFAKQVGYKRSKYEVYIVDYEHLIEDDFSGAKRLARAGSDSKLYVYDEALEFLLAVSYDEETETVIISRRTRSSKKWQNIIELHQVDYFFNPTGFFDKNTLAILSNKDTDKIVLRKFNIVTQKLGEIVYQHPDFDLTGVNIRDGKLESVSYFQNGIRRWHYFESSKNLFESRLLKTFVNSDHYIIDRATDDSKLLIYVNASDQPGQYLVYEASKDSLTPYFSEFVDLAKEKFSASKVYRFKSPDGTQLEAYLTSPKDLDYKTLLVMPHGGPINVKDIDQFNAEVQYYVSRGFSVLRVNFRGSAGFGKAFAEQGVGQFGQLIEQDISQAVNLVLKDYQYDHLCSIGSSYGGYSAAMLAIMHPDRYDCVVGAFGVYDLPLLFNHSNYSKRKGIREAIERTVGKYSQSLKNVSPVSLYHKLKAPILLIAGRADKTAYFEHSNRFKYLLKQAKHPVETMFYNGVGHGLRSYKGKRHELAYTYDFIRRRLDLPLPKKSSLSKQAWQAIGEDFTRIADGFEFDDYIEPDSAKSFDYYRLAAEFGEARANYNTGIDYYDGENVKQDLQKALTYFKTSAALGYASAYTRLADMYMQGDYLEQDWQKALDNYKKAFQLEDEPKHKFNLAIFYCTAAGKFKDFDKCLDLMDISDYEKSLSKSLKNKAEEAFERALAWIISTGSLTSVELNKIQELVRKQFDLDTLITRIEDVNIGVFDYVEGEDFGDYDHYVKVSERKVLSAKASKDRFFGITYHIDIPGINSLDDRSAVVYIWRVTNAQGFTQIRSSYISYGAANREWSILKKMQKYFVGSTFHLEVYDLNQKKLLSKKFKIEA